MSPAAERARGHSVAILGLLLVTLTSYASALPNGFVQDDHVLIEGNARIRSLANLPGFFVTDLFQGAFPAAMYYRPLVISSFALEYAIAGDSPFVHHLSNVLLHALVAILLYALSWRLFGRRWLSLVAAALFAVHPVNTEVVAVIAGRGDLLGACFLLLAAILHTGPGGRGVPHALGALLCVALALLCKESLLVALAFLPLVDLVGSEARGQPLRALRGALRERAGFWVGLALVVVAYATVRGFVTASGVSMLEIGFMADRYASDTPMALKLATCAKLLGIYFRLLLLPWQLSADYDFAQIPVATSALALSSLVPLVATLALLAVAARSLVGVPALAFGIGLLLMALLPVAFLFPFANIPLSERYLYLPCMGLCVAIGALVARVPARARTAALIAVALLLVLPASVRTALRNPVWRNDDTLWAATVETSPLSAKAQSNRALSLARQAEALAVGDPAHARALFLRAARHYARALEIDPQVAKTRLQYGLCLAALERYQAAETELATAAAQGLSEAWVALYRVVIRQSLLQPDDSPERARALLERARRILEQEIRPQSPPEAATQLARELDRLEAQLAGQGAPGQAP